MIKNEKINVLGGVVNLAGEVVPAGKTLSTLATLMQQKENILEDLRNPMLDDQTTVLLFSLRDVERKIMALQK